MEKYIKTHLCEAKMWLGREFARIKEEDKTNK